MTWPTDRLSRLADVWPSNVDKHSIDGQPTVRLCNYTDVYKSRSIKASMAFMAATATAEQIERFRLVVGDTVITKDSETADDIGVPAFVEYEAPDLVCGYHLAIVRPHLAVAEPRFVYWALSSDFVLRQWSVLASGVTRVALRSADLLRVEVPRPPLAMQQSIADYLDRETAQIDTLIAKQEQLIATLRERRRGMIAAAVFGDLADEPRAASPVQWLPSLPEDWGTTQLGLVADTLAGWAFPSEGFTTDADHVRLLRGINVKPGLIDWRECVRWDDSKQPIAPEFRLRVGDIVLGMDRPFVSDGVRVASVAYVDTPAYLLQRVMRIRPGRNLDGDYLSYIMTTSAFADYLTPLFTGVSVPHISEWQVRKFVVPVPPLGEQRRIVQHLQAWERDIDALVAKAERFIELAKERRTALITAAVTGQIDVRAS